MAFLGKVIATENQRFALPVAQPSSKDPLIDLLRASLETCVHRRRAVVSAAILKHLRSLDAETFSLPVEGLTPRFFRALANELERADRGADYASCTRGKMLIAYHAAKEKAGETPELRHAYREFQQQFPAQNVSRYSMGKTLGLLGLPLKQAKPGRPRNAESI